MSNALYTTYKENLLGLYTHVDIDADTIKLVITDHGTDTPVPGTDQFLSDISTATVATSGAFTTKSTTGGVFDADDVTLSTVSGNSAESINIYEDSGSASTSDLMVYLDTATGLPVTPNGGDITIQWDSGANKIFALNDA